TRSPGRAARTAGADALARDGEGRAAECHPAARPRSRRRGRRTACAPASAPRRRVREARRARCRRSHREFAPPSSRPFVPRAGAARPAYPRENRFECKARLRRHACSRSRCRLMSRTPRALQATSTGPSARTWAALGTVYLVWGSTYLAIRVAIETLPPFLMAATRFLVAGSVLFVVSPWRGGGKRDPIGPAQWRAATIVGGALLLGGNGGGGWAGPRIASGGAALLVPLLPPWMAVLARAFSGRGLTPP